MKRFPRLSALLALSLFAWACRTEPPIPDEPQAEPTTGEETEEAGEPDETREDAEPVYEDPQGRFSVPIPPKWSVEKEDGYVTMLGPDKQIKMHLLALDADTVGPTIEQSWPKVAPKLELEPTQTLTPPAQAGLEDITIVNYKVGEEGYVKQAVGWRADDTVYLTLIEGGLVPIQKRNSQVQLIAGAFQKSTVQQTNLTGVQPAKLDQEKLAAFEAHVKKMAELFEVPGASVGIVQNGEVVYTQGFGKTAKDGKPITPDTLMMIGSTSKTMTTMLMASAVDDGKLKWEDAAQTIVPRFSVKDADLSKKITVENLVCACTGVPRRDFEIFFNFNDLSGEDVVESLETFEFFTDFGEAFQYSNQMVATGGYVTAAALGSEWGKLKPGYIDAMDKRVFGPIGMTSTYVAFDKAVGTGEHALPHARGVDFDYEPIDLGMERFVTPLAPAGAVWSNTNDLTKYLITQLNQGVAPNGERVVSAKNLARTWTPQVKINASASYGLGWIVADYKGQPMLSHGGNTLGFTSELAFLPESKLGITILSNGGAANSFASAVRNRLFEIAFDLDPEATKNAEFAKKTAVESLTKMRERLQELDPKAVKPYTGTYLSDELGELTLSLKDGKLTADAGEFVTELRPMVSEQTGKLVYVTVDPPMVGAEMQLTQQDGKKVIQLGQGVVSYTFVAKEE